MQINDFWPKQHVGSMCLYSESVYMHTKLSIKKEIVTERTELKKKLL